MCIFVVRETVKIVVERQFQVNLLFGKMTESMFLKSFKTKLTLSLGKLRKCHLGLYQD